MLALWAASAFSTLSPLDHLGQSVPMASRSLFRMGQALEKACGGATNRLLFAVFAFGWQKLRGMVGQRFTKLEFGEEGKLLAGRYMRGAL